MNKIIKQLGLLCCLVLLNRPVFAVAETVISSPDGKIKFTLASVTGSLFYSVWINNKPAIDRSPMVMSVDNTLITSGSKQGKIEKYTFNETYPWYGAHAMAKNNCNGARIAYTKGTLAYTLDIRVYNDGAAFRLIIPGSKNAGRIPAETTAFVVPAGSAIWYHDMRMHYEGVHVKKPIEALESGEWVAPPATFKLPGNAGYVAVTEADLKDYAGMALQADGKRGLVLRLADQQPPSYPFTLRYPKEDSARLAKPAVIKGTITTPWRAMIIGKDLNAMVNSDLVWNLCPPPDKTLFPGGIKTSWVVPGPAVWKYLDGGGDGTPAVIKEFSRQAAELGFKHNILEGFWSRWSDDEMRDVVNYSKNLGVGIWVWKHSKSLHNTAERQAFFKHCHDLGIAGVKIDFFDHEAKEIIDLYQAILHETAAQHLLLDFHGANKPTGLERTWPNVLTYEAVKGMEASKLEDRATHETTIPFTRFLAGPAEYTVTMFNERRKNTTWTHQIASAAILSAPLLTYAANPQALLTNPAAGMIKSIPSTWDETLVLPGSEIGELAAYARRKGNTWFIAVMNGAKARNISIPLSFLGNGSYKAAVVEDAEGNAAAVKLTDKTLKKTDNLTITLGEGGGYIARLTP